MARSRKLRKRENRPRRKTNKRAKTAKRVARRTRVKARRPRRHARVTRRRVHGKRGGTAPLADAHANKSLTGKGTITHAAVHKPAVAKPAHLMTSPFGSGTGVGKAVGTSGSTKSSGSGWGVPFTKKCDTACDVTYGSVAGLALLAAGGKAYLRWRGNKVEVTDAPSGGVPQSLAGNEVVDSQPYVNADGKVGVAIKMENGDVGVLNWEKTPSGQFRTTTQIVDKASDTALYNDVESSFESMTDADAPTLVDSWSNNGIQRVSSLDSNAWDQYKGAGGERYYNSAESGDDLAKLGAVSETGTATQFTGVDSTGLGQLKIATRSGNSLRISNPIDIDDVPPELADVFKSAAGGGGATGLSKFEGASKTVKRIQSYRQKLADVTASERSTLESDISEATSTLEDLGEVDTLDPLDGVE